MPARTPSSRSAREDRDALLCEYGRLYGELGLAIAFTRGLHGDDAKRCTTRGWQHTEPLTGATGGERLLVERGKRANPVVVLGQSGLIGVECDTPEDLERVLALGLPKTRTVQSSEPYKLHFWFRPPNGTCEFVSFRFENGKVTADKGRYFCVPPAVHPSGTLYAFRQDTDIALVSEEQYDEMVRLADRAHGTEERQKLDVQAVLEGADRGERDESAYKYACSLRSRRVQAAEAEVLMEHAWRAMEQVEGDEYPLNEALKKVGRVYEQFEAGAGKKGAKKLPPPTAPLTVARALLADHYTFESILTLRHWRGGWQEWQRSRWAEVERATLTSVAYAYTEHAVYAKKDEILPWSPNRNKISDLLDALAAPVHLRETVQMPSWLDGRPYDGLIVAVENGLLDVPTRTLTPHTPQFFNSVSVPFPYDLRAPKPTRWLKFLHELWPDGEASIATLQEWFGYVISGRIDLHKILLMVGPTRGGKGVIARVLGALIGRGNVAAPTLRSLQETFGLQDLIGKALAVVADVRLARRDATTVVERLLSLSGADLITVDRKYKSPWTGQIPARFMLLSNELPQFGDASAAIAGRFVTLLLSRSWLGKEDHNLEDALYGELPGILNWALDGLARLQEQDAFTRPASTQEVFDELVSLASPVTAFVRECCVTGPEYEVAHHLLYDTWHEWAVHNGHTKKNNSVFGRDLKAAFSDIQSGQRGTSVRHWVYVGIDLIPAVKSGVMHKQGGKATIDFSRVRRPK